MKYLLALAALCAGPAFAVTPEGRTAGPLTATSTGTCPATGGALSISTDGMTIVAVDVQGTFTATILWKGTIDGTHYFEAYGTPVAGGVPVTTIADTAGIWIVFV